MRPMDSDEGLHRGPVSVSQMCRLFSLFDTLVLLHVFVSCPLSVCPTFKIRQCAGMERYFFGAPPLGAEFSHPPGKPSGLSGPQGSITASSLYCFLDAKLCKCILHSTDSSRYRDSG